MVMLEKVEMRPGAAPAAFPSPIFAGSGSVLVFPCFCAAPSKSMSVDLFIGVLGQDLELGIQTDDSGHSRGGEQAWRGHPLGQCHLPSFSPRGSSCLVQKSKVFVFAKK